MVEDNVELLKIAPKGDASVTVITHNSNSDVFVKRMSINNNLTSMDYTNAVHKNGTIIRDAWEDDAVIQDDHQELDNSMNCIIDRKKRAKLQKVTFWRIVHNFLSATSFHGLPLIAATKSFLCGLTFWMIPILIALGLMLWALISVTKQYYEMNTVLFSTLNFNKQLLFPAVTICNKNYFRKSVFESTGTNLNEIVQFLHVASGDPFLVEDFDFVSFYHKHKDLFEGEGSVFYLYNAGHQLEQMVYSCTFAGKDCLHNFIQRSSYYGNCYTFNSGINASLLYSTKRGHRYGLELLLNAEEYEYFLFESDSVGFNVFIHDQSHFPYYDVDIAFSISTGLETQVTLSRTDYRLLTLSDGGKCRDDVDLKYFTSYSYSSCIVECFTDFVVDTCGCKLQYLPGPADVCKLANRCSYNAKLLFDEVEQCNCPIACNSTIYETTHSYSKFPASHFAALLRNSNIFLSDTNYDFPDFVVSTTEDENGTEVQYLNENFNKSFLIDNMLKLLIYYDTFATTTMEEGLEYSTFQFIADFGGHIGLFTGAGFLTIFEIIQLCCGLIRPAYGLAYVIYD